MRLFLIFYHALADSVEEGLGSARERIFLPTMWWKGGGGAGELG